MFQPIERTAVQNRQEHKWKFIFLKEITKFSLLTTYFTYYIFYLLHTTLIYFFTYGSKAA